MTALVSPKNRYQRTARRAFAALWTALASALLLAACASTGGQTTPTIGFTRSPARLTPAAVVSAADQLTVATLNIAHARRDGFHQLFQSTVTAIENLNAIAAMLEQREPDIVALQEADGPSFWSGSFNHVEYLADSAAFRHHVRAEHVQVPRLSYGTALLSGLALRAPLSVSFSPGLSPLSKGFVVSTIDWPGSAQLQVDVVSLHLDPFSAPVRRKQALELIETLRARGHPLILMGDFNTEWQHAESAVRMIAETLQLKAYQPHNASLHTFPALARRLDWILISPQFEFVSHQILPDELSDHLGVLARLKLANSLPAPL